MTVSDLLFLPVEKKQIMRKAKRSCSHRPFVSRNTDRPTLLAQLKHTVTFAKSDRRRSGARPRDNCRAHSSSSPRERRCPTRLQRSERSVELPRRPAAATAYPKPEASGASMGKAGDIDRARRSRGGAHGARPNCSSVVCRLATAPRAGLDLASGVGGENASAALRQRARAAGAAERAPIGCRAGQTAAAISREFRSAAGGAKPVQRFPNRWIPAGEKRTTSRWRRRNCVGTSRRPNREANRSKSNNR